MFVGAYWSSRKESLEAASERITDILTAIASRSDKLATWYDKGWRRADALGSPIALDPASIAKTLSRNRRDSDRQPIPQLGFRFDAWNGESSLSATLGCRSQHVRNAVVLKLGGGDRAADVFSFYRGILDEMVRVYAPDYAVVSSRAYMTRAGATMPWEAGLFTYARGGTVQQHVVGALPKS